jgi:predicted nucleic acid-binding Zn ribbon protein
MHPASFNPTLGFELAVLAVWNLARRAPGSCTVMKPRPAPVRQVLNRQGAKFKARGLRRCDPASFNPTLGFELAVLAVWNLARRAPGSCTVMKPRPAPVRQVLNRQGVKFKARGLRRCNPGF